MRSKLKGDRAVITGAASGLGRSLALALAEEGWTVGIVDVNDAGARETLQMVERAGGRGGVFHADVTDAESVKAFTEHFFEDWGGVDLLVNNAGVLSMGSMGEIPLEDWDWVFDVNFMGTLYGCHEFIPRMRKQGWGHVLNIASVAGIISLADMSPYNATKAAVISLSETLRMELGPDNIGVTVACPIWFRTDLLSRMRYTEEWDREWAQSTFDYARVTSDEIARRIIKAIKKNRLYVVPQLSARLFWLLKRAAPEVFFGLFRLLNRVRVLRPLAKVLARLGLIQY